MTKHLPSNRKSLNRTKIALALLMVCQILPLAGCSSSSQAKKEASLQTAEKSLYSFNLFDAKGKTVSFSPSLGKPALVAFWSPEWDPDHLYHLNTLSECFERYHKEGLEVYAISYDDKVKPAKIIKMMKQQPLQMHMVLGHKNTYNNYQLQSLPSIYLFDKKGQLKEKIEGHLAITPLAKKIKPLLK